MRRLDVDVVHAHWLPYWGAAAGLARTKPLVAGAMGSDVYLLDGAEQRLADMALAHARAVLAPSPHATAVLRARNRRPDRCVHLETGIDLDAFRPPSGAERASARHALGLGDGPAVLSFRGGGAVYGLPLAIEAFRRLRERRPDAELIVVHGRIPLDSAAKAAVRSIDWGVHVLGAVPHAQMRTCFHAADVGISVPSSDGSPVSLWECLACGTPAVCSQLPQLADRVGERSGVLLAERTPPALAAALDSVLTDSSHRSALGLAGREWCQANMDRRDSLERLGSLYQTIASPSGTLP